MVAVSVNTGPISADDPARNVSPDKWFNLMLARRTKIHTRIPYDCRSLLEFVAEADTYRMWEHTGHANLDAYIREGLEIDPELLEWAKLGLSVIGREQPISLAAAVDAGKRAAQVLASAPELLTAKEAGKKGGRGKRVTNLVSLSNGGNDRLAARLKRDHPAIAARVAQGEFKSIRAAALEAGIVKPMRSVPTDSPDRAIRALLRVFSVVQLAQALGRASEDLDRKHQAPKGVRA